jgi:hypothetical protein
VVRPRHTTRLVRQQRRDHGPLEVGHLVAALGHEQSSHDLESAFTRFGNPVYEFRGLGRAVVRDQKPMDDAGLQRCLRDGLAPTDCYRLLNARVFFWLTRARLHRMLTARPYRELEHDVLELNAAALVTAHRPRITLSPINSGATKPFPRARGRDTFLPITDYPYANWRSRRAAGERVVELSVLGGVPDVERFVQRAMTMSGEQVIGVLFERS